MSSGNMERVLRLMAEKKASDVFLSANAPIQIKINGQIVPVSDQVLTPAQPRSLVAELLSEAQLDELDREGELNIAIGVAGVASFRLSAFRQRGSVAAVFRCIPFDIPTLEALQVPPLLGEMMLEKRGLIMVVGATGTGKSTTLAAMIEHRNRRRAGHVLTIEDPVEFVFNNKLSIVNQREVGRDVKSLDVGLRNALRQAPDCLLIGEIRDRATMQAALSYALSGHLVLSTLHANNAYHALGRILSFYTPESRPALLDDLSAGLKAIVSQRLLRSLSGGRLPAIEIMRNTQLIAEKIAEGDLHGVKGALEQSMAEGSQTFEQDLARLIHEGKVSREEALAYADSPTNLMWRLDNQGGGTRASPAVPDAPVVEDGPSFTDITLDVHEPGAAAA